MRERAQTTPKKRSASGPPPLSRGKSPAFETLMKNRYGLDVPLPAGEVGSRALELLPAAGSAGLFGDMPG